jgi:transcription initiation factor TFIIIB Brf1 subunit/transcription initiation factor TFIIB
MFVMFCCCCCCCCCVCVFVAVVSAPSCAHADPDEDDAAANDAMTASPRHDNGRRRPFRDSRLLCTFTVFSAFCTHTVMHTHTHTHTHTHKIISTPVRLCTYQQKTASKMSTQKEHSCPLERANVHNNAALNDSIDWYVHTNYTKDLYCSKRWHRHRQTHTHTYIPLATRHPTRAPRKSTPHYSTSTPTAPTSPHTHGGTPPAADSVCAASGPGSVCAHSWLCGSRG